MEKIQIEFLRFCANASETVPIFDNLRSISDGSLDFPVDWFI